MAGLKKRITGPGVGAIYVTSLGCIPQLFCCPVVLLDGYSEVNKMGWNQRFCIVNSCQLSTISLFGGMVLALQGRGRAGAGPE